MRMDIHKRCYMRLKIINSEVYKKSLNRRMLKKKLRKKNFAIEKSHEILRIVECDFIFSEQRGCFLLPPPTLPTAVPLFPEIESAGRG